MAFASRNKQPLTPDEALSRLERYCAYQERCSQEVRRKLADLGVRGEEAQAIFRVLEGEGFVDDARFSRAFAGGKFRVNRWGRVRIRLELQRREIAPALIDEALAGIDEAAYVQTLQDLLDKKRRQYAGEPPPQMRAKVAAALIRAGFEPELVFRHL